LERGRKIKVEIRKNIKKEEELTKQEKRNEEKKKVKSKMAK
jgi:hypothetical protein